MKKEKALKVMTVADVARQEKVCEETIRRAVKAGRLKSVKIDGRIFLSDFGVMDWSQNKNAKIKPSTIANARVALEKLEEQES